MAPSRSMLSSIVGLLLATLTSAQSVAPSNESSQLNAHGENTYTLQTTQITPQQFRLEALTDDLKYSTNNAFEVCSGTAPSVSR